MIVLGINSVYHESAAAVVRDGVVVAAAEEERFNRTKHGKPATVEGAHLLPVEAIRFCLSRAGIAPGDVDLVCYSFDPELRRSQFAPDPLSQPGEWGDPAGEAAFLGSLARVEPALEALLEVPVRERLRWVPHHLAHAASAYYPSGFSEAAVLVVDGIAENASTLLAAASGSRITALREIRYPHSLGFLWEKVCKYLGFSEYDACKVMGLSAYGVVDGIAPAFERLARVDGGGFTVDGSIAEFRLPGFTGLEALFGRRRCPDDTLQERHRNLARVVQHFTEAAVLELVRELYRCAPSENLCVAGGVGLNCVANWRLKEQGPYANVFIPPAPNDAGTAMGAALFEYHRARGDAAAAACQADPYLGPEFSRDEVLQALRRQGLEPATVADPAREAAARIARGEIVAWFQGRMEFGPRALGNRSLLGDPRTPDTREHINHKVKHREAFRPFGPSVLAERAGEWFELGRLSPSYEYMLFACPVRRERWSAIPAVVHVDGTSRIQVVHRERNPRYHELIREFDRLTGVPLVLNTSFNDREPITCSPDHAAATFMGTRIDALVMDEFLVVRN